MHVRIRCMPNGEFDDLRFRLKNAIKNRHYEDIVMAFSEAVSDPNVVPERMPKIIDVLKSLLNQVAGLSPPDLESGAAIAYILWHMSLSTSLHETCVRQSEADGADTVLVLGFGGSGVEDLEPQAAFYHKRGLTVISTTRVSFPPGLGKEQDVLVAEALRAALKGGGGMVLHACSQHGIMYGANILWLWSHNRKPFDNLPPLQERLKALVFDCAAPPNFNPDTKTLEYPTEKAATASMLPELQPQSALSEPVFPKSLSAAKVSLTGEDDPPSIKSQTKYFVPVMLGCLGALCLKWKQRSVESMFIENKNVRPCIVAAARFNCVPQPWVVRLHDFDTGSPSDPFAALQLLDWSIEPAVPRLFLYSEKDMLITVDRAEAFIRHTKAYRPEAVVQQSKLTKSAHCKNWVVEPEESAAAVSKLLELAEIPAHAMGA